MSNSTIWRKSCEKWQLMWIIWSIAFLYRAIEAILNRVSFILRKCSFVIFTQIRFTCSIRDHSRCLFRICLRHFWIMKSRAFLSTNAFIVTRKIIYTKEIASSLMRILNSKEFTCKKEEFISIFITLMSFTFEWFLTKVKNNALKTLKN
jgi:hypothetical protein